MGDISIWIHSIDFIFMSNTSLNLTLYTTFAQITLINKNYSGDFNSKVKLTLWLLVRVINLFIWSNLLWSFYPNN